MTTRFDHAVIAVGDLEQAIEVYRSLGFDVFPGGRHENRGTHNALIRFGGADYIELLGVYDPETAIQSGLNGRMLAEFTRERAGGLVGHCYATDDIEVEAARMRQAGLEMVGPFEMRRARPDGRTLAWRLLVPEDIPWRRRWPFFIQWDESDEERLAVEGVGDHPNSARSVAGVSMVVRDIEEAASLYSTLFDSKPIRGDEITDLAAVRASFKVQDFTIDLLSPTGDGPISEALAKDGEGPCEVTVTVADIEAASGILTHASLVEEREDNRPGMVHVPARLSLGGRLAFTGAL